MIGTVCWRACCGPWQPVGLADWISAAPVVKVDPQLLHDAMRKVYVDQILWTRMVTLSVWTACKGGGLRRPPHGELRGSSRA